MACFMALVFGFWMTPALLKNDFSRLVSGKNTKCLTLVDFQKRFGATEEDSTKQQEETVTLLLQVMLRKSEDELLAKKKEIEDLKEALNTHRLPDVKSVDQENAVMQGKLKKLEDDLLARDDAIEDLKEELSTKRLPAVQSIQWIGQGAGKRSDPPLPPSQAPAQIASQPATSLQSCLAALPGWVAGGPNAMRNALWTGSEGLTDKTTSHRYYLFYHTYLSRLARSRCEPSMAEKPIRILEIGLGCAPGGGMLKNKPGGSARAWRHMFASMRLDLHIMEYDAPCATQWAAQHSGIHVHTGDQSSVQDLERVYAESGAQPFDAIIDDGSHLNEHQIKTLEHMIQHVAPGGFYVVEDIMSSCLRWKANIGAKTEQQNMMVEGTAGCMQTASGQPTIYSRIVEWQKPLLVRKEPFPGVTHIDVHLEAAVFDKLTEA
eukprot:2241472-Rhodomonas_salina.1